MNTIQKNASDQLDAKARDYMRNKGCDYRTAVYAVARTDGDLSRGYAYGDHSPVKSYDLTAPRREMLLLVNDPERTRRLASALLDRKVREKLVNIGKGVDNPSELYRAALSQCKKDYPTLAVADENGFIADDDFALLAMLIPSVAAEVERGNYSARCSCGERKEYCRGKKLAHKRGVDEDDVKAFSQCILDARDKTELDKVLCFF